jgi:hypothetical protein
MLDASFIRATDILDDDQLKAIGRLAAEWGMLEAAVRRHGTHLLNIAAFDALTGNPGAPVLAERLNILFLYGSPRQTR